MARRTANKVIAMRALDAHCRRRGFPRSDQGGGSGRLASRRHVGDRIVGHGERPAAGSALARAMS